MSVDANILVKNDAQASSTGDALLTTTYADDYIARGNGYKANAVFELAGTTTLAFVLDPSALSAEQAVFILPITIQSSSEEVRFRIYESDNYTSGTVVNYYNANRNASDSYDYVVEVGVTGYETTVQLQEHAILASSQGVNESSAQGGSSNALILNNSKVYVFEIENLGSGATTIEYDTTIYQI